MVLLHNKFFMKNCFSILFSILICALPAHVCGQSDPGRAELAELETTVYFATDGDPAAAGPKAEPISEHLEKRLRSEARLRFSHYRAMGGDTQAILRSYENWAEPLKPSDEILVRFETRTQPNAGSYALDLELWLSRKKVLKTDVLLLPDRPLFILGPKWRGGNLVIAVQLASNP